jgi:hypothetical protein
MAVRIFAQIAIKLPNFGKNLTQGAVEILVFF